MPLQKSHINWAPLQEGLARRNQMAAMEDQGRGEQAMAMGQQALQALVSSLSESEESARARKAQEFQEKLHAMGVNERREEANATRAYDARKFKMDQDNEMSAKQATNDRLKQYQDSLAEERTYQRGAQAAEQARRAAYDAADYYENKRRADAAVLKAKAAGRTSAPKPPRDLLLESAIRLNEMEARGGHTANAQVARDTNMGIGADKPPPGDARIESSFRTALGGLVARAGTPQEKPEDKALIEDFRKRLGIAGGTAPTTDQYEDL